jgi:hypothetical protein
MLLLVTYLFVRLMERKCIFRLLKVAVLQINIAFRYFLQCTINDQFPRLYNRSCSIAYIVWVAVSCQMKIKRITTNLRK